MAEEYIKRILAKAEFTGNFRDEYPTALIHALIDSVPAADVQPVRHGRWLLIEYPYGQKTYICSECKNDDWWNGRYAYGDEHYCPNCGANMREEKRYKTERN